MFGLYTFLPNIVCQERFWNYWHEEMHGDSDWHACLRFTWEQYSVLFNYHFFLLKNARQISGKCVIPNGVITICNQTFSLTFIVAVILDEKSNIFLVLISISVCLQIKAVEKGRSFIWNAVCMLNLKIDVREENGVLSLKNENNGDVTNNVMFAYSHEKIMILLSVLSTFLSLFFMILTWIHKVF